jgi:hypothetical protein
VLAFPHHSVYGDQKAPQSRWSSHTTQKRRRILLAQDTSPFDCARDARDRHARGNAAFGSPAILVDFNALPIFSVTTPIDRGAGNGLRISGQWGILLVPSSSDCCRPRLSCPSVWRANDPRAVPILVSFLDDPDIDYKQDPLGTAEHRQEGCD